MTDDVIPHPDAGRAMKALRRADPLLKSIIIRVGPCLKPAPVGREPFEALLRAITHQQLNGKAAEAILNRFIALYPGPAFPAPAAILASDIDQLRGVGLSGSKVAAIRDLCARRAAGEVPSLAAAHDLSNDALIEQLTKIRGIGRWSVEMLLIFGLGRPDVLPVDDFGVREGHRKAAGLEKQLKPGELNALGVLWAPWRSFASWYFWQAAALKWDQ